MSLNQEDKELLVIYIDGSPSSDQIDQAQNLLKESEEARKFENVLRNTKSAIIDEYQSDQFQNSIDRLSTMVSKKKLAPNFSFLKLFRSKDNLSGGFSFVQTGGSALLGATFSFALALIFLPSYLDQNIEGNIGNYDFSDSNFVSLNKPVLRGQNSIQETVQSAVRKMIEDKSISGEVIDGNDIYSLTLVDYFEETDCYEGNIQLKNVSRKFLACQRGNKYPLSIK